jgi:hypothetical protein
MTQTTLILLLTVLGATSCFAVTSLRGDNQIYIQQISPAQIRAHQEKEKWWNSIPKGHYPHCNGVNPETGKWDSKMFPYGRSEALKAWGDGSSDPRGITPQSGWNNGRLCVCNEDEVKQYCGAGIPRHFAMCCIKKGQKCNELKHNAEKLCGDSHPFCNEKATLIIPPQGDFGRADPVCGVKGLPDCRGSFLDRCDCAEGEEKTLTYNGGEKCKRNENTGKDDCFKYKQIGCKKIK